MTLVTNPHHIAAIAEQTQHFAPESDVENQKEYIEWIEDTHGKDNADDYESHRKVWCAECGEDVREVNPDNTGVCSCSRQDVEIDFESYEEFINRIQLQNL